MEVKMMKDMQKEVDVYIGQFKEGYFSLFVMMVCLMEEMGEFVREVNYYYGEKLKKIIEKERSIEEEFGDVLFVMICMVNSLNIDLEIVYNIVMNKFNICDKDCWICIDEGEKE